MRKIHPNCTMSGRKHTEETKQKIRDSVKRTRPKGTYLNTGKTWFKKGHQVIMSNETKNKIKLSQTGKTNSMYGKPSWNKGLKGYRSNEKSHLWKGGITPLNRAIRCLLEYKQWRKSIFKRDNYTCQKCFTRGCKLHSHHTPKSFALLLSEFLQFYSQFSPIEDKEILLRLAINYAPFWDITNGKTLCKDCHKRTCFYENHPQNNQEC